MADLRELVKKEYIENDKTLCFETTPISKIAILWIVSLGVYSIVIFYSYWKTFHKNFGHKLSPFWRAWFSPISGFMFFPLIEKYINKFESKLPQKGKILATLYLCCWLASYFFIMDNSISMHSGPNPGVGFFSRLCPYLWGIIALSPIIVIQRMINNINKNNFPEAPRNGWKLSNTIWTVIFVLNDILILGDILKSSKGLF